MSNPTLINMVLCVELGVEVDLAAFFHLISIPIIAQRKIKEGERKPVPYFGHEGILISIRYKGQARGYRAPVNMHSFGDADLQLDGRNYHFKLSPERINILGLNDPEKIRRPFEVMIEHIKQVERNWAPCRELSAEKINATIFWVWHHITISHYPPTVVPSNVDARFALLLTTLTNDSCSWQDFCDRSIRILYYMQKPLYAQEPYFRSMWTCNKVYNFKLPSRLSLHPRVKKLHELGYKVSHHNIVNGKSLSVSVPVTSESPCSESKSGKADKPKFHRFTIRNAGTVNQTSPTSDEEAYHVYRRLVLDLGFVPYHKVEILGEKTRAQLEEEARIRKQIEIDEAPKPISPQIHAYLAYVFAL